MISSLEMLAGVSLAEEGILRLVFAAVYLVLNKGGNDNDVSAASRYDSFYADYWIFLNVYQSMATLVCCH